MSQMNEHLQNQISFSSNFWGWPESPWHDWTGYPRHKWYTEKGHGTLCVELPGVKKNDIRLYVRENKYLCLEADKIDIRWVIGNDFDLDKIKSEYKDGLLTINFPARETLIKDIQIA